MISTADYEYLRYDTHYVFADSHLHMTDPEFSNGYKDIHLAELLFSNTSTPGEFTALRDIASKDGRVVPFYGTHPWFLDRYDPVSLKSILDSDSGANVGEIGLDSKHGNVSEQMPVFIEQLDIAQEYDRIVSIHMVGTEEHVLRELRKRKMRCILHSYSSPEGYTEPFVRCGCFFSISPRLFSRPAEKVSRILRSIPIDRILMETDHPSGKKDVSIHDLAEWIGQPIGIEANEVMELTLRNAHRILRG